MLHFIDQCFLSEFRYHMSDALRWFRYENSGMTIPGYI